jgi:hypothetical protein
MNGRLKEQCKRSILKTWFFEKTNEIDKPLTKLTKRKEKKTQINKIRDEKEGIITDTTEILRNYIPVN